ncbi:hypothetical protein [Bartonella tamiae]|nr:hypothetical protein [Bartonella tamiae]
MFNLFVVNIALPTIQNDLGVNLSQMGLIITGYELGFAGLLIVFG